jgi:hypothetical protein
MLRVVETVYDQPFQELASLSMRSIELVCSYFGLTANRRFLRCSDLGIPGESSRRVLDIVTSLGGGVYVTGQGARNYLDHELFEASGVRVEYLDYRMMPYPQLHGAFTPYVTILDLMANVGRGGASVIASPSVYWREFLK